MKKILSILMSATLSLSMTAPMISVAEDTEITTPDVSEPIPPEELPYFVSGSGDSVSFDGDQNYDYIISTNSKFSTERKGSFTTFTPEENGEFIVSRIWLENAVIYYPVKVLYDLMEGIKVPDENGYITEECNYFYPHIQNFEVTYTKDTGIQVEFLGEKSYTNNASYIASGKMGYCPKFTEMPTDAVLDYTEYYTLASCNLLGSDNGGFFMYFDYARNDKKDKSLFCIDTGYAEHEEDYIPVSVSGNAEITSVRHGGSWIDGNLETATCDEVSYVIIEPTGDGLAEVHSFILNPNSATVLTVKNGQFLTERNSLGCEPLETGDLNMDYRISIADAVVFQKYILGSLKLTDGQKYIADMNDDGSVDIFDMVLIRKKVISNLPIID